MAGELRTKGQALAHGADAPTANTSRLVPLGGSYGTDAPPALVRFVATDFDNADESYGEGDVLELEFDLHTVLGQFPLEDRPAVDALFGFSAPLGQDYSGAWHDCITDPLELLAPGQPPTPRCRGLRIAIVDATPPRTGRPADPPAFGRTLAWVKPPAADTGQPIGYTGLRSALGASEPSQAVIVLGTSAQHLDGEPMHPSLDVARRRLFFMQRASSAGWSLDRTLAERPAAAAAAAEGAMLVRQCDLDAPPPPEQRARLDGGLTVREGSCNNASAHPPPRPAAAVCGLGGARCGVALQRSDAAALLVRPPGAPLVGNTSVGVLGADLGSVRLCQLLPAGAPFGSGLAAVTPVDASGLRCAVPPLNASGELPAAPNASAGGGTPAALRLSEDGEHFFETGLDFVYFAPPELASNAPHGEPRNGSRVTVRGARLAGLLGDASAARCRLGGAVVTPVDAIAADGTSLLCRMPPLAGRRAARARRRLPDRGRARRRGLRRRADAAARLLLL